MTTGPAVVLLEPSAWTCPTCPVTEALGDLLPDAALHHALHAAQAEAAGEQARRRPPTPAVKHGLTADAAGRRR